jgi:3-oxoacyl-[acyl-carrier-protein] synthase-3
MKNVYITSTGAFLPNDPVDNERMERVLGFVGGKPSRLRERILKQNGIVSRHYALDDDGKSTHLNEELAANAIASAVEGALKPEDLEMIACGTTQGDVPVPGFASMVHGRLATVLPTTPALEVASMSGVCCAGMAALSSAFRAVQSGQRRNAVACGSELVSRCMKASRFEAEASLEDNRDIGYRAFDADFLRFMLSDGAGAVLLENRPSSTSLSLRIEWIEMVSHAHERPVCMYTGMLDKDRPRAGNTWLDWPNIAQSDRAGMMKIRQDTKLLPEIVKLGVEEYLRLIKVERIRPDEVNHVLCHYSSHFFKGEIQQLLAKAGVAVPEEKWFTNLYTKGNTGAASIFIMLDEAMRSGRFKRGENVLLMVPESGRFQVSFALLKVVDASEVRDVKPHDVDATRDVTETNARERRWSAPRALAAPRSQQAIAPPAPTTTQPSAAHASDDDVEVAIARSPLPEAAKSENAIERYLGVELALVWTDFERMLRNVPIVARLESGDATIDDYQRLLVNLRQQVMEGARWIARAASNISIELFPLRSLFIGHAGDEHKDYQMLERDFVAVGGALEEIVSQPKNIGSEALSAFMFHQASQPDPLDLIGAMFVVEGLGKKKAAHWAELLRDQLALTPQQTSFLTYHGKNDDNHFDKLRDTIRSGFVDERTAKRIVKTAKTVARLYALQLEEIDHV